MIGDILRRGGKRLIDKTSLPLMEIVQQPYTTSASARPQRLSNGWIVSMEYDATTYKHILNVSKDNGNTWSQLCYTYANGFDLPWFSICSYGTNVYFVRSDGAAIRFYKFDATVVTNSVISEIATLDSVSNAFYFSGQSIAVNPANGHLTAAWSSKNSTYPNSFNIRSAKSVDGGVTWTKQDGTAGVDQLTVNNSSSYNNISPCVIYKSNGLPTIFCSYTQTNSNFIFAFNYTTYWQNSVSVNNSDFGYIQSSPNSTVQRYGTNAGRIWVAWTSASASSSNRGNIAVKYSDDNGVTWSDGGSSDAYITTGATYFRQNPSITTNNLGEVSVLWWQELSDSISNIIRNKRVNGIWGSEVQITNNTSVVLVGFPSTCDNYYDFEQPIAIWRDNQENGDKILLQMNGTNGSTTFTDNSGKVWTANGNAQISTAQSKFGGASAYFDGSGDYIQTPTVSDMVISTGFTLDLWFKRGIVENREQNIMFYANTNVLNGFEVAISSTNYIVLNKWNSNSSSTVTSNITITDTNWHHLAISYTGSSTTLIKMFIDGALVGSATSTIGENTTYPLIIGKASTSSNYFNGYIDDFRFTKGIARWTSNFTPPTVESVYSNNPPSVDFYGKYFV